MFNMELCICIGVSHTKERYSRKHSYIIMYTYKLTYRHLTDSQSNISSHKVGSCTRERDDAQKDTVMFWWVGLIPRDYPSVVGLYCW